MWPMRCGKPSTGTCSPTHRVVGTGRPESVRGGISPAFQAGPARTLRPHRRGRPIGWPAHWTGTSPPTGTRSCPRRSAPPRRRPRSRRARRSWPSRPGCRRRSGLPSGSWWDHDGALAVVFTGLPGGDLVLPVRLPQGAGQWAHLAHFLADPNVWHKIDLVRVRDRKAPGGWRYYAHLLVHQAGYQSPATQARRGEIPPAGAPAWTPMCPTCRWRRSPTSSPTAGGRADRLTAEQQAAADEQPREPGPGSGRWIGRGATPMPTSTVRRCGSTSAPHAAPTTGWRPARSPTPAGPGMPAPTGCRCAPTATTRLSGRYRRTRADHAAECPQRQSGQTRPRWRHRRADRGHPRQYHHRRRQQHQHLGSLWGKRIALFSPGMLVAALSECAAAGGQLSPRRHPPNRAVPALPMRGTGPQDTGPAHPRTAHTAGCS